MNQQIGRILIIIGTAALITGIIFIYGEKLQILKYIGKLPGDINIKRENFSFYFPITTCIILSIIVSLIFSLITKLK